MQLSLLSVHSEAIPPRPSNTDRGAIVFTRHSPPPKLRKIPSKEYLFIGLGMYVLTFSGMWLFVDIMGFPAWLTSIFWGGFLIWMKWIWYSHWGVVK